MQNYIYITETYLYASLWYSYTVIIKSRYNADKCKSISLIAIF